MPIGTARMTNLGLANSELHVAADLDCHPRVRALADAGPWTVLLFPGPGAIEPWAVANGSTRANGTMSPGRSTMQLRSSFSFAASETSMHRLR